LNCVRFIDRFNSDIASIDQRIQEFYTPILRVTFGLISIVIAVGMMLRDVFHAAEFVVVVVVFSVVIVIVSCACC
jgi:hypothetical protein